MSSRRADADSDSKSDAAQDAIVLFFEISSESTGGGTRKIHTVYSEPIPAEFRPGNRGHAFGRRREDWTSGGTPGWWC